MSDFRCPRYWWDGNNWRCQNLPNDCLELHDFDTYCTDMNRCLECPYMDIEVRERVEAYKKDIEERTKERIREIEQENKTNTEKRYSSREEYQTPNNIDSNTSTTTNTTTSSDSETGCLTVIFDIILVLIGFILKLLRPFFLVFYLPNFVSFTLCGTICLILAVIFALTGIIPLVCIFMALVCINYFLFFPFWIILIWQKFKKRLSWKEVCSFYWKWFIKGPFAYPALAKMLEEKQSMPKVVAAINKVSGWFKKIFTKKPKD